MSKAQEVRKNILARRPHSGDFTIDSEAHNIFNWILNLMDSSNSTLREYFGDGDVEIWLYYSDEYVIHTASESAVYKLPHCINFDDEARAKLFHILVQLFEKEVGFTPKLNLHATVYDFPAITFSVHVS